MGKHGNASGKSAASAEVIESVRLRVEAMRDDPYSNAAYGAICKTAPGDVAVLSDELQLALKEVRKAVRQMTLGREAQARRRLELLLERY